MREIKFRAWDVGLKKFHYPKLWDNSMPSNWERWHNLQQYTGLKDKHGKEIYDGDVVKIDRKRFYSDGVGVFVWKEWNETNSGSNDWMQQKAGWHLKTTCQQIWTSKTIEVIGNIYENPELLK